MRGVALLREATPPPHTGWAEVQGAQASLGSELPWQEWRGGPKSLPSPQAGYSLPLDLSPAPNLTAPDSGLISLGLYPCLRQRLKMLRSSSPVALKTPFLTLFAETLPLGPQA